MRSNITFASYLFSNFFQHVRHRCFLEGQERPPLKAISVAEDVVAVLRPEQRYSETEMTPSSDEQ